MKSLFDPVSDPLVSKVHATGHIDGEVNVCNLALLRTRPMESGSASPKADIVPLYTQNHERVRLLFIFASYEYPIALTHFEYLFQKKVVETSYIYTAARYQHPHHVSSRVSTGVFHKYEARNRSQRTGREASRRESTFCKGFFLTNIMVEKQISGAVLSLRRPRSSCYVSYPS